MTTSRLFSTVFSTLVCLTALAQEGAWTGKLDVQGMSLPLVFNFSADGCTLDSPAQGVKGIKGERTITEEGKLRVTVAAVGVTFEGLMEGDSIKGLFLQGGLSLPLTLRKGMMQMRRPQTPVSPFPYTTEEVRVARGNIVLSGTLTLPPNCNCNTPVVVMVTGSGQQNRDEEIFGHRPFAVLADALARHGIASLRYDDRGYGNAALDFSSFTTDDFKDDAEAVIRYLRNRFSRVGVIGHSEGGTIALMIAAEGKADYVVTMAAMAVSGLQTLVSQHRASLAQAFLPVTVLDATHSLMPLANWPMELVSRILMWGMCQLCCGSIFPRCCGRRLRHICATCLLSTCVRYCRRSFAPYWRWLEKKIPRWTARLISRHSTLGFLLAGIPFCLLTG